MNTCIDDKVEDPVGSKAGNSKRLVSLKPRRKWWLQIGLYLGFFAGLVLVLARLTEGILVFMRKIVVALNSDLYVASKVTENAAGYRQLMDLVSSAQSVMLKCTKLLHIYYPLEPGLNFIISFTPPDRIPGEQVTRIDQFVFKLTHGNHPITLDSALASAKSRFPDKNLKYIWSPADENGAYRICWDCVVDSLRIYIINWRWVGIDQYSGEIIDPSHDTQPVICSCNGNGHYILAMLSTGPVVPL